jgi:hypothetical protein
MEYRHTNIPLAPGRGYAQWPNGHNRLAAPISNPLGAKETYQMQ